ncbi:MAG: MBL fold metallo-hydrolase [Gammaproteobacteria bacterium]|nr:MBL fold metallo-hydrolase [Gammaproteobacteria bacterium]
MILRQLFDYDTWTYSYLVADPESKEAVLIDPVLTQIDRDLSLLSELELNLKYALDTHVHADHVTASGHLREKTQCKTGVAKKNGVACADLALEEGETLTLGQLSIHVLETPGHTPGCLSFKIGHAIFTGDALFIRGCGRTDFQQGNAGQLYDSIQNKLLTLPDKTIVYPGHDYQGRTTSTIGEEKNHNPRLQLSRSQFVEFMKTLNLANPKLIMEAVPSNQSCGK